MVGLGVVCKTLIVEDNVTFRQMFKESLGSRFPAMEIEEAPDGRDLFNKIESFHPKIVFMDIRLPGENGLELTKKIKRNYPDIIIVVITSYDLPEYRQAARESMADYFVPKGSSMQEFRRNTGITGRG
jgi:DNA-binding NarL/FixJ family response regulator